MKNYIKPDILKWYIYKILFIMRLTTVILMISMLQISAATVAQEFNYVKKGVSLIQVFKEIKKQTGYNIIWNEKKIDVSATIDADFKKATIQDVLNKCLKNLPLSYSINDKMVMIKENEPSFRDKIVSFFTAIDVRGRVVDENDAPLVGAVVKVKGTSISTPTNSNGEFLLRSVDESAVLVISFVGYITQEVKPSGDLGSVKLMPSIDKLEEVEINAGYYTVSDREKTGSISRITSKNIEKQPVNNVLQAMQANIPGLQISQTTGIPGGGFNVRIRGQNSLSQGNEPFYIINGVPFTAISIAGTRDGLTTSGSSPLASINPLDIESIEILKDADATAIYGSRGANGVILITTKHGKHGKSIANLSINQGLSRVAKKIDLMNTEQYLEMRKEAYFVNDKLTKSSSQYATQYDINGTWGSERDIDWQKELIGGTAPTTNIQSSFSGGSDNLTYLIGGNYYREGTVFPGESVFARSSGNFSLQYISDNKKFNIAFDANYSQLNSNTITTDITQFILLPPNYPALLDDRGALNWANNTMYENPIANVQRPYDSKINNLVSNAAIGYSIIPSLKMKANFGYTKMDRKELSIYPLTSYSPVNNFGPNNRWSYFTNNSTDTWIIEGQADWTKSVGSGHLNMLVGTTFQQGLSEGQEIRGAGYTSDALMGNIAAASIFTVQGSSYFQYRYTAIFGRLNYSLMNKYIINLTGRRDGSSRFGMDNRFANFGAVGAAWIVSEEKFLKENLSFISFAKLRGSYGITGNDRITDYGFLELWNTFFNTYQGISTMYPAQISNPNYAWEINKKAEAAVEIGLLKDRINISLGYYSNRSSNQLLNKQLAPSTGFQGIQDNLPATVSNVGWEFVFSTKNFSNNLFSWTTSFNLTIPRNKLINYPDLKTSGADANKYEIGYPLSVIKLYNTSVDSQTGLYSVEDYDKDGIINSIKDRYIVEFIGRKYYGGVQNTFSYKGIEVDVLLQFVKQSGLGLFRGFNYPGSFQPISPTYNQSIELLKMNRWKNAGDIASIQKYSTLSLARTPYTNATGGHLAVDDASFLRLKNISVSYKLPTSITEKIKLNNAKLFIQAQNLFTISSYKGLDPEIQNLIRLPSLQVLTGGLQVTF